ncbi:unnamed protein product [Sympodiomycopsis kandeliae]
MPLSSSYLPALTPNLLIPLCLPLFFVALSHLGSHFLPVHDSIPSLEQPFLASLKRAPGVVFMESRLAVAPILYGFGHIAPALAWTVLIPLQHSKALRARYMTLHRVSGYIVLLCSTVLAITGAAFKFYDVAFIHADNFHLHRPWKETLPWIIIPNAQLAIWLLSPWTLFTVYKTISAARQRNINVHKFWASMLTFAGLAIHIERWAVAATCTVGALLSFLPLDTQDLIGIPRDPRDWVAGEMAAFALTLWVGVILAGIWSYDLYRSVRPPKGAKVE